MIAPTFCKNRYWGILALAVLASCGQSPKTANDRADSPLENAPYELQYSDVMEFTRGVEQSYEISGSFDFEEEASLTIDGLPADAVFAGDTLTWLPPCTLKPENGHFLRGYMVHRLRINLQSLKSDSLVQKPALLLVHMHGEGSACED